ncbi:hypothetical protein V6Z11_A10G024900 [Gossypium hirsutum]
MPIHLHHVGLFEPEGILARNPSSTPISTKKGEEIHGLLARYGCKALGYGTVLARAWLLDSTERTTLASYGGLVAAQRRP